MDTAIHVDDEVFEELQRRAVEYKLVFGTENDVLRKVLELDPLNSSENLSMSPGEGMLQETKLPTHRPKPKSRRGIGNRLRIKHELDRVCEKGYYNEDGRQYPKPKSFPAALFDVDGFLIVYDEDLGEKYAGRVSVNNSGIYFPVGISAIADYSLCKHKHE